MRATKQDTQAGIAGLCEEAVVRALITYVGPDQAREAADRVVASRAIQAGIEDVLAGLHTEEESLPGQMIQFYLHVPHLTDDGQRELIIIIHGVMTEFLEAATNPKLAQDEQSVLLRAKKLVADCADLISRLHQGWLEAANKELLH